MVLEVGRGYRARVCVDGEVEEDVREEDGDSAEDFVERGE